MGVLHTRGRVAKSSASASPLGGANGGITAFRQAAIDDAALKAGSDFGEAANRCNDFYHYHISKACSY